MLRPVGGFSGDTYRAVSHSTADAPAASVKSFRRRIPPAAYRAGGRGATGSLRFELSLDAGGGAPHPEGFSTLDPMLSFTVVPSSSCHFSPNGSSLPTLGITMPFKGV